MSVKQIKFLVPVAFSPQSDIIIEQASNLAKYYQAQITLMCVIDTSRTKGFFSNPQDEKKMLENAKNRYEELVMKVNAKYNIGANSIVIEGRTYESIVSVAKSIEADFIIMGAAGATGFKSHFIGSNAMRTIKRSHCPVITIRGRQHRSGCKNIVLPLDLTKDTAKKVESAIDMAKLFGDSTIRIVSILDTNSVEIVNTLHSQIQNVWETVNTAGVECTAEFVRIIKGEDTFSSAIIAYAHKVEGDVIMIMTQQETNPTEFFIGSSAQSIIGNSDIPVMSVLPK